MLAQARKHEVLVSVRLIANVSTSVQVRKKQVLVFPQALATSVQARVQVREKELLVVAKWKVLSLV